MEEACCRKIPPDRTAEDSVSSGRSKKSKKEVKEDALMSDKMEDVEGSNEEVTELKEESKPVAFAPQTSYKDSLLGFKGAGFNGVAYGSSDMEEDPLLSDLLDQTWKLLEPSDEVRKLMDIYPVVPISSEEFNEGCKPWNNALVITVLGAKFHLYKLKEQLTRIWQFSDFELVDLPNNYYVVRFSDDENWGNKYKRVLFEGPWVVFQHSILVQKWSPSFDPFHNPLRRIATWVRIPHIPLHCYTKKIIWRLGDMIGKTIKVDMNTITDKEDSRMKVERGKFARICVEIDLQKKLVPRVICASALFNVEYEGLVLICFACGRYGHRKEACPWKNSSSSISTSSVDPAETTAPPSMSPERLLPAKEETFGPWMFARGSQKSRMSRKDSSRDKLDDFGIETKSDKRIVSKLSPSRFAAIADLEEDEDGTNDLTMSLVRGANESDNREKALTIYEKRNEVQNGTVTAHGSKSKLKSKEVHKVKSTHVAIEKDSIKPITLGACSKAQLVYPAMKGPGPRSIQGKSKNNQKTMGQRAHVIVSGSMSSSESMIINQKKYSTSDSGASADCSSQLNMAVSYDSFPPRCPSSIRMDLVDTESNYLAHSEENTKLELVTSNIDSPQNMVGMLEIIPRDEKKPPDLHP